MKCPTCGADLQIEDEKCSFCGNPNPFAMKHQQDMRYYQQEFQKTKQEVEHKTGRFTSFMVKITIIALLLVLVIGMAVMSEAGPYKLWRHQMKKDLASHRQTYITEIDDYEQAGDWRGLYAFYDAHYLYYDDVFGEYQVVYYASCEYVYLLDYIMRYSEDSEYRDAEKSASQMADLLDTFYKYVYRTSYTQEWYDRCYTQKHQDALEQMRDDMEAVLVTYCCLTKEEVALLPDYSIAKKSSLLKEGLLRKYNDSNAVKGIDEIPESDDAEEVVE